MDLGLAGKVAAVTGSSRGIGRGIAMRLVEEGAHVVFSARGAEALEEAVAAAEGPGGAHGVVADVSTPDGAAAVVDAARSTFGGLDVVVLRGSAIVEVVSYLEADFPAFGLPADLPR